VQNTAIHDSGPQQGYGVMGYCIRRYVIRKSFFYGKRSHDIGILNPSVDYQVCRNIFWRDSTSNSSTAVRLVAGQHGTLADNIVEVASHPQADACKAGALPLSRSNEGFLRGTLAGQAIL
jgi:hypothetical protein